MSERRQSSEELVTIFGGSGFVGRQVVRALAKRGYRIRVGVRRPDLAGDIMPLGGVGQIHAVQATIAGQGIGLLSLTLVAEELASGVLVQPFALSLESYRYDLVYSARAAEQPATRLLRNWVKSEFAG